MNSVYLYEYQKKMIEDNPAFPVRIENYDKISEYCITIQGLEQLFILKRQVIMGDATLEDIAVLGTLLEIYALTNPSKEKLREAKKYFDTYMFEIFEIQYNPDLIKEGLVICNKKYDPKYDKILDTWIDVINTKIFQLKSDESK